MTKKYGQISRDSSHDDRAALKAIKREVSNLQTPKHADHGKQWRGMTTPAKDSGPGNSE